MIKFLDEVPMTSENSRFAVADITDIYLDEKNPRFASSVIGKDGKITQKDIINHLVKYSNIKELMAKIRKKEGLFDEDTISGYIDNNNKLIVLEGNRRITSCKILLDNSLLSEENSYIVPVPTITNKLKENISRIKIIVYENSQDAQDYIASKHTKPDILRWTPFEQYNYYYVQFQTGKTALEIADSLNGSVNDVKNSIREYQLFNEIINKIPSDFELEKAKVLPLIKAFMPGLTTTGPYKLELDYDENNLKYEPKPDKVDIYDKILLMLAEAFWLRPKATKKNELLERPTNAKYAISTEELKAGKRDVLIRNNIRIPGLIDLISEYNKGYRADIYTSDSTKKQHSEGRAYTTNKQNEKHNSDTGEAQSNDFSDANTIKKSNHSSAENKSAQKVTLPYFFEGLEYSHLSRSDPKTHGILRICSELTEFSQYKNKMVEKYPLCAVFLTRAIIEASLEYYSRTHMIQGTNKYIFSEISTNNNMNKLSSVINRYFIQLNNYISDSKIRNYFNDVFENFDNGTGRLNWVIHRPAEYSLSTQELISLPSTGLLSIINYLIQ